MNKPIMIVGLHRSGTTWLAKVLSLPRQIRYISEPFNPNTGLKVFTDWMVYISSENEDKYYSAISDLIKVKGKLRFTLPNAKFLLSRYVPGKRRVMMKGIGGAIFSAEWMMEKFDMQVVAIMRHPVAFYVSLKRLGWHFDFNNLLKQESLMRDHLEPFRELMEKDGKTYAQEAGILWLIVNTVLDNMLQKHPDWYFKRHEDLSMNPVGEYKKLYNHLGLEFTTKVEEKIKELSSSTNKAEGEDGKAVELKRNSKAIVTEWKKHVTEEEIITIQNITQDLGFKYYPKEEW